MLPKPRPTNTLHERERVTFSTMSCDEEAIAPDGELPPAVSAVRPLYKSLFAFIDLEQAVTASSEDTQRLGLGRDGFTYGETTLASVWRILASLGLRGGSGAAIKDLGSGIGNVVVAVGLIAAAGALGEGAVRSVRGIELLPTLHAAAVRAVAGLRREWSDSPLPLPHCSVECSDLLDCDLSDCDIAYMASTVFEDHVLEWFARRAAETMRPGSRVVTLARALKNDAFSVEAIVPCVNSWGEEDAYINVRVWDDAVQAGLERVVRSMRTEWQFDGHGAPVKLGPSA